MREQGNGYPAGTQVEAWLDTAGTFPSSEGLLDTGSKVGMGVAGTAVQSVNLFSNEDEKYRTEVIDFQKHCWRL